MSPRESTRPNEPPMHMDCGFLLSPAPAIQRNSRYFKVNQRKNFATKPRFPTRRTLNSVTRHSEAKAAQLYTINPPTFATLQ